MSCHWTTPQGARISSHESNSARRSPSISSFCKDSCTLSWGARKSGRTIGEVMDAARSMHAVVPAPVSAALAAALLLTAPTLLAPASASASGARPRGTHSCAYANLRPTTADAPLVERATLCLIDRVRAAYRLRALRANHELQALAGSQASGMVLHDYFSDNSSTGETAGTLIAALPYGAHAASLSTAQNVGWGTSSAATPAGILAAWMRSSPHREVILTGGFRDAGVGVSPAVPSILGHGERGATYAVEFAVRG
jgi:uncharacterized protein YkwD